MQRCCEYCSCIEKVSLVCHIRRCRFIQPRKCVHLCMGDGTACRHLLLTKHAAVAQTCTHRNMTLSMEHSKCFFDVGYSVSLWWMLLSIGAWHATWLPSRFHVPCCFQLLLQQHAIVLVHLRMRGVTTCWLCNGNETMVLIAKMCLYAPSPKQTKSSLSLTSVDRRSSLCLLVLFNACTTKDPTAKRTCIYTQPLTHNQLHTTSSTILFTLP